MIWLLYLPFVLLCYVVCFLTNPIVVLFADENGELHGFWHLWQTWDNSVDTSDVYEHHELPDFLLYDWDKHYIEYVGETRYTADIRRKRWYTTCINDDWTLWERFQRYICRVYWLTRNCAYGWCFYVFGQWAFSDCSIEHEHRRDDRHYLMWGYDDSQPIWYRTWWIKIDWYWTERIHTEGYLGWKINFPFSGSQFSMIAHRLIPIKYHKG
jgi:hypothetical protein